MSDFSISPYNIGALAGEDAEIHIYDTTIATYIDGKRIAPIKYGVKIARMLNDLMVEDAVVATPSYSDTEKLVIRELKKLNLATNIGAYVDLNKGKGGIDDALDTDIDFILLNVPASEIMLKEVYAITFEDVKEKLESILDYIKVHGIRYGIILNDASRTDLDRLNELIAMSSRRKVERVELEDWTGILMPEGVAMLFDGIKKRRADLGIRAYNDFGMALANSLAGIRHGARWVGTSLFGVGLKAGITSLEQLSMALRYVYNMDIKIDTLLLGSSLRKVAKLIPNRYINHSILDLGSKHTELHDDGWIKDYAINPVLWNNA